MLTALSLWPCLAVAQSNSERVDRRQVDESFFVQTLFPMLQKAECHVCHTDNGVASDTELAFPEESLSRKQIAAFGLTLAKLVDRQTPQESLLLLKPTNRDEHAGDERIKQGSAEEVALLNWVHYLATLTDDEVEQAHKQFGQAGQRSLNPLLVRRLTHSQYNRTVRDLLRDQTRPANRFPKEDFVGGFKNQAGGQTISPLQAEAYSKAAERLAIAAFRGGDHLGLFPRVPPSAANPSSAEEFIKQFGLRAYRRPLTDKEVASYLRLYLKDAIRDDDYLSGARTVVETMLQSPHFLFRIERGSQSPWKQYELVSRLSYLIWDTMPSDELLGVAQDSELANAQDVRSLAHAMLSDPLARQSMEEFLGQWLRFDRVLEATRDRRKFGQFNTQVALAMVEETKQLFNHLVWSGGNFMEIYSADYTFLSRDLAAIYDLPVPDVEFSKVAYPADSGRAGILGHGSFLVATSKPAETSPTERGLFIRNKLLSQEVPAPPPGVNATLPEVDQEQPMNNRQRLAIHLNSKACASCHQLIDPIGLGFEQYDPIGAYQETMSVQSESGGEGKTIELELDTTGRIQGIDDSEFTTPKQLGRVLSSSKVSQRAVVKQLFRYAFGRHETIDDEPTIERMLADFRNSNFRFQELILSLVTSELFLQE